VLKLNVTRLFDQFRSLRRFPVPIAYVLLLTLLVDFEITFLSRLGPLATEAIYALGAAVFASLLVDLAAEGRSLNPLRKLAGAIGAGLAAATLQLLHGKLYD